MEKRLLDMSHGDPLYPFRSAARYAFAQAARGLNKYQFMNRGHSQPEIRRTYSAVSDHFTKRGIKPPNWTGLSLGHFTMTGGGTTEAYDLVISYLAEDVRRQNARYSRKIKPAIIMPVPTYGFFMNQPDREEIEIITIARPLSGDGHVTPELLHKALDEAHEKGLRVIAYYDSNPHNPLGIIRGEKETRALADIFLHMRRVYRHQDEQARIAYNKSLPLIEHDFVVQTYKEQYGRVWDGPASRIRIIDDIVYEGLEYGGKKPFAFAQVPELFDDTFTLAGPSKAGLVNLRGGVLIGYNRDIADIEKRRVQNNYFPAMPTLAALEAYYSPEKPFAAAREKHMNRMNDAHRLRGLFMKALINGLDTLTEADETDKKKIINTYARLEKCGVKNTRAALNKPVRGVRIITTPQAGFFHLVDFSALRGASYDDAHRLESYYDLASLISEEQNIGMTSAGWLGLPREALVTRATFAIAFEDILEYSKRLRRAVKDLRPPKADNSACCTAAKNAAQPAPAL